MFGGLKFDRVVSAIIILYFLVYLLKYFLPSDLFALLPVDLAQLTPLALLVALSIEDYGFKVVTLVLSIIWFWLNLQCYIRRVESGAVGASFDFSLGGYDREFHLALDIVFTRLRPPLVFHEFFYLVNVKLATCRLLTAASSLKFRLPAISWVLSIFNLQRLLCFGLFKGCLLVQVRGPQVYLLGPLTAWKVVKVHKIIHTRFINLHLHFRIYPGESRPPSFLLQVFWPRTVPSSWTS